VTREAEWTDAERLRMLSLAEYERGVCDCGLHESLASDAANHFTFETRTCPVCRGIDRFARIQGAADESVRKQRGDNAPPGTPDPADGRRLFVKQLSPGEVDEIRSRRGANHQPRQKHE
jgi:hypothetical protein